MDSQAEQLHKAALSAFNEGQFSHAEQLLLQAIALAPSDSALPCNLGTIYLKQGKHIEAKTCFESAIAINPSFAIAHNNLGELYAAQRDWHEAITAFSVAIQSQPGWSHAWKNLGVANYFIKEFTAAEVSLKKSIELDPNSVDAHLALANIFQEQSCYTESLIEYEQVIQLAPHEPLAYVNRGNLYMHEQQWQAASTSFRQLLSFMPEHYDALLGLAECEYHMAHWQSAEEIFTNCIAVNANLSGGYIGLAKVLQEQGNLHKAAELLQQALSINGVDPIARLDYSLVLFRLGRYEEALIYYESRLGCNPPDNKVLQMPALEERELNKKNIFLYREQGIGDELLFAACYNELIQHAKHVTLECEPRLLQLWRRSFPGCTVISSQDSAAFHQQRQKYPDMQVLAAGSLPKLFRASLEKFPEQNSYLHIDKQLGAHYEEVLARLPLGARIGIAWNSGMRNARRDKLFPTFSALQPLLEVPGIQFVNLQYEISSQEVMQLNLWSNNRFHKIEGLDLFNDIDGLAALTSQLDLVISPVTMLHNLAGSLGVENWAFVAYVGVWQMYGTDTYPWYPKFRSFKQQKLDHWQPVVDEMCEALQQWQEAYHG